MSYLDLAFLSHDLLLQSFVHINIKNIYLLKTCVPALTVFVRGRIDDIPLEELYDI